MDDLAEAQLGWVSAWRSIALGVIFLAVGMLALLLSTVLVATDADGQRHWSWRGAVAGLCLLVLGAICLRSGIRERRHAIQAADRSDNAADQDR